MMLFGLAIAFLYLVYFPYVLLKFWNIVDVFPVSATNFPWTVADSVNNSTIAPGINSISIIAIIVTGISET